LSFDCLNLAIMTTMRNKLQNKPQNKPLSKPQSKPHNRPQSRLQDKPDKRSSLSSPPHAARALFKERFQMASNPKIPTIDAQAITAAQAVLASAPASADAPGVDKIRELLFGNQMQDYDKRFAVLDERFQQKMRDLEGESARTLGSMESSIKKQLDSIASQVRQEQDLRADADKELGRGLREQIQGLEKRLGQVSDQLATLEREFTERLGHESQGLRDDLRRRTEDTRANIERMFSELSNVKTDRNLLAGLFVEIARCLNQDMTQKGGKVAGGER
jgi:hypothetical protein